MFTVTHKLSNKSFQIEFDTKNALKGSMNGERFSIDLIQQSETSCHVIYKNQSFNIELISKENDGKNIELNINGKNHTLNITDPYDKLLKELGIDITASLKVSEIKAPMPGLVLDILVSENDTVKLGDSLLVLEAMKMENNIKSPIDGIIKSVQVKKSTTVEKNQILIQFQ